MHPMHNKPIYIIAQIYVKRNIQPLNTNLKVYTIFHKNIKKALYNLLYSAFLQLYYLRTYGISIKNVVPFPTCDSKVISPLKCALILE